MAPTSVNQQHHRPRLLLALLEPLRLQDPPLHIPVQRSLEPELLAFREVLVREVGGREVGDLRDGGWLGG